MGVAIDLVSHQFRSLSQQVTVGQPLSLRASVPSDGVSFVGPAATSSYKHDASIYIKIFILLF